MTMNKVTSDDVLLLDFHIVHNFHLPLVNLSMTQKGVLYSGSRLFNILPTRLKSLSNDIKLFRRELRSFLLEHTLYSLDEFYQATSNDKL